MSSLIHPALYEELIAASLKSEAELAAALRKVLQELGMTVKEFSEKTGIPESTLHKILSGSRDIRLSTLRVLVKSIKNLEAPPPSEGSIVIGVVAAPSSLRCLTRRGFTVRGKHVILRMYPAKTIEDAIIAAIVAEREGAHGIVCAEIVGATVRKFVRIPVAYIYVCEENFLEAVKQLISEMRVKSKSA